MLPTPSSYDCKVGSNELKWQQTSTASSNGTLTIDGTFYFDGSLSLGSGQEIVYNGLGSLYFTGGVSLAGGAELCGIANCTTYWNTSENAIILVAQCWANSTGSSLIAPAASTSAAARRAGRRVRDDGLRDRRRRHEHGPGASRRTSNVGGGSQTLIPFDQANMPLGTPQTAHTPSDPPSNWSG